MSEEIILRERLDRNGIPVQAEEAEKLAVYWKLLNEWNQKMDLTAVTKPEEMVDRHFVDSLMIIKTGLLEGAKTLIDVGTGAGFPGLPLAIIRPEITVTLLDSQRKRLDFLAAVCEKTQAGNVVMVHSRAEEAGKLKQHRERYDLATARAVAPLNVLCEYLLPFVRTGGRMICWKGPALKEELEAGRRAAHLIGGRLEMPIRCPIEGREWEHILLPVLKVQRTPSAYPRKAGTPKNHPLGET